MKISFFFEYCSVTNYYNWEHHYCLYILLGRFFTCSGVREHVPFCLRACLPALFFLHLFWTSSLIEVAEIVPHVTILPGLSEGALGRTQEFQSPHGTWPFTSHWWHWLMEALGAAVSSPAVFHKHEQKHWESRLRGWNNFLTPQQDWKR